MEDLKVVGEIARELGVEFYRVEYVVRKHNIEPSACMAARRFFGPDKVEIIKQKLAGIKKVEKGAGNNASSC